MGHKYPKIKGFCPGARTSAAFMPANVQKGKGNASKGKNIFKMAALKRKALCHHLMIVICMMMMSMH